MPTRFSLVLLFLFMAVAASGDPLLRRHNSRPLDAEGDMAAFEPWETPIEGFFIRSHHEIPVVDAEHWTLVVDGLVEKPLTLTLKDLQDFPTKTLHAVLECSGNGRSLHSPHTPGVQWERGALGNAEWTGAVLSEILAKAGVKPNAKFARLEGTDGATLPTTPPFVRSVPIKKLLDKDTLLAWKMNRQPLPVLHGGPLRLVLPGWYGENWMKWVSHVTLTDKESSGFYMAKGYRLPKTPVKPGQPWDPTKGNTIDELRVQSLLVSPRPGEEIEPGDLYINGKAFSGEGTITAVEISTDHGKHWSEAKVEAAHADGGWQEFSATIKVKAPGALTVLARATDSAGNQQPVGQQWNPGGYVHNWADEVRVAVRAPSAGDSLLSARCLTCHTREMVATQRLSAEAWDKEVTKMQGFGAKLTPEEHKTLVRYLSHWTPKMALSGPRDTDFSYESSVTRTEDEKEGEATKGMALYATHCANCHGNAGEGLLGPRLRGRMVTHGTFLKAVLQGRGVMPPFAQVLKPREIVDIRAFLNQPVRE